MKKKIYIIVLLIILSCSSKNNSDIENDSLEKSIENIIDESPSSNFDTSFTINGTMLVFEFEEKGNFVGNWKEYYKNGVLKETGQQSDDFGCGMFSGLFEFFDTLGVLTETKNYFNWIENQNDGCHSTRQDITVKEFYKNRSLKAEKFYETSYEGEEFKSGNWLFYNEDGELTNSEKYNSHYAISNFNR